MNRPFSKETVVKFTGYRQQDVEEWCEQNKKYMPYHAEGLTGNQFLLVSLGITLDISYQGARGLKYSIESQKRLTSSRV